MPKLYFYDTGLALSLMGVETAEQLRYHPFRGNLFETLIVEEFLKRRYNSGKGNTKEPPFFFLCPHRWSGIKCQIRDSECRVVYKETRDVWQSI